MLFTVNELRWQSQRRDPDRRLMGVSEWTYYTRAFPSAALFVLLCLD
jgi:hypothetical protein